MEVEQNFEAELLRHLCRGDGVGLIVCERCWMNEDTQPDPVVAVVLEYLESWGGDAIVLEDRARVLRLLDVRSVGSNDVLSRCTEDGAEQNNSKREAAPRGGFSRPC